MKLEFYSVTMCQITRSFIFVLTGRNCEKVKKPARFPARSFCLRRKFDTQRLQIIVYQDLKDYSPGHDVAILITREIYRLSCFT
jgi:hypothetical protein